MQCSFCNATSGDLGALQAVLHGDWVPTYWEGDTEVHNPVCPSCRREHLQYDGFNDTFVLRLTAVEDEMPTLAQLLAEPLTLTQETVR